MERGGERQRQATQALGRAGSEENGKDRIRSAVGSSSSYFKGRGHISFGFENLTLLCGEWIGFGEARSRKTVKGAIVDILARSDWRPGGRGWVQKWERLRRSFGYGNNRTWGWIGCKERLRGKTLR